jgi:hypothetical protein
LTVAGPAQPDIRVIPDQYTFEELSRVISNIDREMDCYFDAKNLPVMLQVLSSSGDKMSDLKSRGARLRFVTEIRGDNMSQCKEVMKNFELFHLPSLTGSFLIADEREYVGYLRDRDGRDRLLHVTNQSFVDAQRFLYNSMIASALPAQKRITEIGRGAQPEFMETIRDPLRIKPLVLELVRSAVYEIAILFSTKNSFLLAEREGLLEEAGMASKHGTKVKILVMQDEAVKKISDAKLKTSYPNIQVNYLQQFLPTKITTVIVDQAKCLTIEVDDDSKETLHDAVGLSTYSNSESTLFSNVSMFDSLWIQAELDKQNKAREAYFKMFKGFKLKDEIYNRRWEYDREK